MRLDLVLEFNRLHKKYLKHCQRNNIKPERREDLSMVNMRKILDENYKQ